MSEIPTIPSAEQLETVRKYPWQTTVFILLGVIGSLFTAYQFKVGKSDDNCEGRVSSLIKVNAHKDSIISDWQNKYIGLSNELLYKNRIIDRQQNAMNKTDSITRERLETPAKQILKSNE